MSSLGKLFKVNTVILFVFSYTFVYRAKKVRCFNLVSLFEASSLYYYYSYSYSRVVDNNKAMAILIILL